MGSVDFNEFFDTVDAAGDETPPPAGTYLAEVEACEWTTAKSSGRQMLKYRLRIVGGPEKDKALFGQIVVGNDMKPFAQKKAAEQLAAIGMTRSDLINGVDPKLHCEGNQVTVETSIDSEYDPSNPRSRVEKLSAASGGPARTSAAPPPRAADVPPPAAPSAPPAAPFE